MAKIADKYFLTDPWNVVEKGFNPSYGRVAESIFSVSNEYMGIRGTFDERYSGDSLVGNYFNGVYSEAPIGHPNTYKGVSDKTRFMVNGPNVFYTRISFRGEELDLARSDFSDFTRELDLRTGMLTRSFVWNAQGANLRLTFKRFTSMHNPHEAWQKVEVTGDCNGELEIIAATDFHTIHEDQNKNFWPNVDIFEKNEHAVSIGETEKTQKFLAVSCRINSDDVESDSFFSAEKISGIRFKLPVKNGESTGFDREVLVFSDKEENASSERAAEHLFKLMQTTSTFENSAALSTSYWDNVWANMDVQILGDEENQQGIRYCIFQMHQTYHGFDARNNVGAKGLTGEAYSGHTFWDTETYCLPYYLFNNPKAARNLLAYRYNTLAQAKEWAREQNCDGACFPFSTIDGTESCGVWWHGNLEIHIMAGIAYGIHHYLTVTGDKSFLCEMGMELLLEISKFYASRGDREPATGAFGFYGVMGADEFHTFVNNNCYTNVMAAKTFMWTLDYMGQMKQDYPGEANQLLEKTGVSEQDLQSWRRMAENMKIPQNEATGVYEQHDGYFLLPHKDVNSIPVEEFPLYHSWCLPRIYRYDMIKQPDVLLLHFFFSNDYTFENKKANYEYYEPRCIHESSLSPSVHSILAAELGKSDEAFKFFSFATRMDLDNYNRNTREGLHTTSNSAAWMNIIYGFGGMRSDGEQLSFIPNLPRQWQGMSFSITHRGSHIKVTMQPAYVSFELLEGDALDILVYGKTHTLTSTGLELPVK